MFRYSCSCYNCNRVSLLCYMFDFVEPKSIRLWFFVKFGGSYIHNLFIGWYSTTFSLYQVKIIKNALHPALNQYYRKGLPPNLTKNQDYH